MTNDYIRRQDVVDAFNRAVQDVGILDADDIETVFGMLSYADVAPVRHGKWFDSGSLSCRCDQCGCKNTKETPFCPFCGAKMDGEE